MPGASAWPTTVDELVAVQEALAVAAAPLWQPPVRSNVAGCFACFPRGYAGPGRAGEPAWAAAAVYRGKHCVARVAVAGRAGAPYLPGLLALRAGALLENATRSLPMRPDVVMVDATGYDHPRRAGLARHLGAVLDTPTIGVTHRPMLAVGDWPKLERGAMSPLLLGGELVGFWVCTRNGRRPLAAHAGWRTDPVVAARILLAASHHRTPAPLREARRLARTARAKTSTCHDRGDVAAANP
jgi:deoxyribonuclease V